jgi:hypothetical protein
MLYLINYFFKTFVLLLFSQFFSKILLIWLYISQNFLKCFVKFSWNCLKFFKNYRIMYYDFRKFFPENLQNYWKINYLCNLPFLTTLIILCKIQYSQPHFTPPESRVQKNLWSSCKTLAANAEVMGSISIEDTKIYSIRV